MALAAPAIFRTEIRWGAAFSFALHVALIALLILKLPDFEKPKPKPKEIPVEIVPPLKLKPIPKPKPLPKPKPEARKAQPKPLPRDLARKQAKPALPKKPPQVAAIPKPAPKPAPRAVDPNARPEFDKKLIGQWSLDPLTVDPGRRCGTAVLSGTMNLTRRQGNRLFGSIRVTANWSNCRPTSEARSIVLVINGKNVQMVGAGGTIDRGVIRGDTMVLVDPLGASVWRRRK